MFFLSRNMVKLLALKYSKMSFVRTFPLVLSTHRCLYHAYIHSFIQYFCLGYNKNNNDNNNKNKNNSINSCDKYSINIYA